MIHRGSRLLALVLAGFLAGGLVADAASAWWHPPQHLTWYWQLTGAIATEPVMASDIDGFDNGAGEVATLHAAGQHAICYVDVGTWENWRPDAGGFPVVDLGADNGWPGERWLDIADPALRPVMHARFAMCAQKGFDAVEPDNMDGYSNNTGFPLTAAQQLVYNEWVAGDVHSLGMAVLQKNDPDQAVQLQPSFDGVLDEQCNEYSECSSFASYLAAGKPVLDAEYSLAPSSFCASDQAAGIMGARYTLGLDGSLYAPCFSPTGGGPPLSGAAPPVAGGLGAGTAPKRSAHVHASVGVLSSQLRVRSGSISVSVGCRSACRVRVLVRTTAAPGRSARSVTLGAGFLTLARGGRGTVRIRIGIRARRALGSGRHRVVVLVSGQGARMGARRTVWLS